MSEAVLELEQRDDYPVQVTVHPVTQDRNRLTTAFRFFLALPHILMVGGPAAVGIWIGSQTGSDLSFGSGAGIIGFLAAVAAVVAWFAIVLTARHPDVLWRMGAYYFRWRYRALTYMTLLRDEYPPFGDDPYPVELVVPRPEGPRDRLTVFFRPLLALPHLIVLMVLTLFWAFTTAVAWVWILLSGRFPQPLYGFALGVLAWSGRVEAYVLLLRDEYPPFTLRALV